MRRSPMATKKSPRCRSAAHPAPRGGRALYSGLRGLLLHRSFPSQSGGAKSADTSVHANSHRVSVRSARRQKNGSNGLPELFLTRSTQKQVFIVYGALVSSPNFAEKSCSRYLFFCILLPHIPE